MQRFYTLGLFLCSVVSCYSQNYNIDAFTYHQSILEAQQNIGTEVYNFNQSVSELNLKILKFEINRSITFTDSLKAYNNETAYLDAAKKLFLFYKDIAEHEYGDLLKIVEDPELEAKDFKDKKIAILARIKVKANAVYPAYNAEQETYCKKYGLKLE
ncbi:MAG: hypothetical protein IPM95_01870 [Sphingobacteriales bacterium]|jgi:hypothetical protein|nr:hypothetical protein [Sphingobacteriales bacterium]